MSNKNRIITIILGAAAIAGLTYGVTRRGQLRRAPQPPLSQAFTGGASSAARNASAGESAADWEMPSMHGRSPSTPDPLDEAPSADDLGPALLAQATRAKWSLRESDPPPPVEHRVSAAQSNAEDALLDDAHEPDEHEDFRRARA